MLKRSFIFNAILAAGLVIGLLFLFFNSLDWLTNHGQQTTVPSLVGKKMKDAVKALKKQGFKIQIDSTFISYRDPLEVLSQEPENGATVKVGRTIFLTVNRKTPPSIDMPNLVNLSFRNAMLVMQSYRLVMGDTIYRPDVAAGSILEQWYKGKPIAVGAKVPFGSKITLVVGEGLYGEVDVPNLIGKTWKETKELIKSLELTSNVMWEGEIDDSATAIVYMQQPEALNELDFVNRIPKGDLVDVRIMQSPSQALLLQNQPGSKKLLGEEASVDSNEIPIKGAIPVSKADSVRKKGVPGVSGKPESKEPIGSIPIPSKKTPSTKNPAAKPSPKKDEINNTKSATENEFD